MTARSILATAAILGALSVALGAFGAHGLKARLTPDQLAVFETGVRYHMFHVLALIAAAWLIAQSPSGAATTSAVLFLAGIALFSGSLYLLATRTLLGIESWNWLGPITPLGGLCFIAGWISLAVAALKLR